MNNNSSRKVNTPRWERDDVPLRVVPHNIDAEQALLGAILINNRVAERVGDILDARHFFDPLHQQIYELSTSRIAAGHSVTPITLKDAFANAPPISQGLEVWQYLGNLAANATTLLNAESYARTIVDLSVRRQLILIGEDITNTAYEGEEEPTPTEQIELAESRLFALGDSGQSVRSSIEFATAADAVMVAAVEASRDPGKVHGLSTGFRDLDDMLGGLQNTDLVIIAGRPSMGKTALATNIAWNVARKGIPVDFRSLEMSAEQLALRVLSTVAEVPGQKFRRGAESWEIAKLEEAYKLVKATPLIIDQTGGLSIAQLASRARRLKRQRKIGLLVVDYLQLMTGSGKRRDGNRVQELTEITTGLKALAKELEIPIIALSQLSRGVDARENKRPQLSDLRESGSIEQDADVVMFVFREEYYVSRARPDEASDKFADWQNDMQRVMGRAEVIVGKQRHGATGIVDLAFDGELTRFSNLFKRDR